MKQETKDNKNLENTYMSVLFAGATPALAYFGILNNSNELLFLAGFAGLITLFFFFDMNQIELEDNGGVWGKTEEQETKKEEIKVKKFNPYKLPEVGEK
jgi:hypothetical protein